MTIEGARRGDVTLEDVLKLNAMMDAQLAAEEKAAKKIRGNSA